jgi:cellulose synthase/poly-beta-1,6-N-acetylglucosamine synthase-like glycosyltransferase
LILVAIVGGIFLFYYVLSLRPMPVIARDHHAPALYVFFVPALNEERVIRNTLESLLAVRGDRSLVLVIDDGSDDATASIVDSYDDPRVNLLRRTAPHARQGKGAALNFAYRELLRRLDGRVSPHDVVVGIVDADGRLQPNAIEVMDGLFSGRGVGAVQTMVRILNRTRLLPRFQDYEFVAFGSLTQAAREKLGSVGLGGNGQFTRLSALMSLGDAPWTDCLTEDLDLGIRLAIAGWRNRYTRETWVEQQGLTSIRKLVRQRVRWCHGHFQCWRLIPRLIASYLPTLTVLDLMYYLLSPGLTLIASVVFVVPFALLVAHLISTPMNASWQLYAIYFTLLYLMSFGPALLLSAWYWRRAKDISAVRAFAIAHALAAYNLIWYVAEWWAIARIVGRRRNWAKTARLAEAQDLIHPEQLASVR